MTPLVGTRVWLGLDGLAAALDGGALVLHRDHACDRVEVASNAVDAALFGGQLWALADRSGERLLERYDAAGAHLGEPLACTGAVRLEPARGARAVALVVGRSAVELRDDCGHLVQHDHATPPIALVAARTWIARASGKLVLRRPAGEVPLEVGAEHAGASVISAALLLDGAALVLELRGRSHTLAVLGSRRGELWRRVRLDRVTAVRFIEQAGHAMTLAEDGSIGVVDLVGRKPAQTIASREPACGIEVDPWGRVTAIALAADARTWHRVAYDQLLAGAWAAPTLARGSEPAIAVPDAEPDPEPEPAPDVEVHIEAAATRAPIAPTTTPLARPLPATAPLALGTPRATRRLSMLGHDAWSAAFRDLVGTWCARGAAVLRGDDHVLRELCAAEYRAELRWQTAGGEAAHGPLGELAQELELTPTAIRILMGVAAPRLWGELAEDYRALGRPNGPLCDEIVLARLLGVEPRDIHELSRELDPASPLIRHGAIVVAQERRPFGELVVPRALVERLRAVDEAPVSVLSLEALRVPREPLVELLDALARPGCARVAIRGRTGSGRRTIAAALAARLGRELDLVDAARGELRERLLEAHHRGAIPLVSVPSGLSPEARASLLLALEIHPGAVLLRAAVDVDLPYEAAQHVLELPNLDEQERAEIWADRLVAAGHPASLADPLAARYAIGAGMIHRVADAVLATSDAAAISPAVHAELRQRRDAAVRGVASRVTKLASWSQLVLPPDVVESLREFAGRVRHRRTVMERWGMDRVITSARGSTALFQGAPGTGKTLVAGAIARELGYDLYRIDLSRVMSKWIGETERNLAGVFDAAEQGDVILLFDEADSLFARRTEVKTSNDRFANLEVNYLLQRLDAFEGFAILTTNFGTSIDPAFKRRLTLRLSFPFPDAETRRELWRVHLPPQLPVAGELGLERLAERFAVTGGYIRNAVLRAAYLAAQEDAPLTHERLERAMLLEYREIGKLAASGSLE